MHPWPNSDRLVVGALSSRARFVQSKKNVTLYLREENDECEDGMCILLKRITA
jgi:hypothetical protein